MKRLTILLCISSLFITAFIANGNGQWSVRAWDVAEYNPRPENTILEREIIEQVDPNRCTACHGNPPDSGAHDRHFEQDIDVECGNCHPDVSGGTSGGHRNNQVDFADGQVLADTAVCDTCHGNATGVSEAKSTWDNSGPISDCTGCHNTPEPGYLHGNAAPAVDQYWMSNGHGGNLDCQTCHNPDTPHFETSYDPRLWDEANALCARCHVDPGQAGKDVSAHGNEGYGASTQPSFVEQCDSCHDPHGSSNLHAVQSVIKGSVVVYTAHTSDNSLDEADSNNADDLCATCHANTGHNRNPANWPDVVHFEGDDCTLCHKHESDGNPESADAFIPQGSCNVCHGNPPGSGAHDRHYESDINVECIDCHPPISGGIPGSHQNGRVDFTDDQVLADTTVCDTCHGNASGVVEAKSTWDSSGPISDCTGCHNTPEPGYLHGNAAPAVDGYWMSNGHGRYSDCQACHNPDAPHFESTYNSRLWTEANALCARCHNDPDRAGTDVSAHGNEGYGASTQPSFVEQCDSCHDPHGSSNLHAVQSVIRGNVVNFTARRGENSLDEADSNNDDDLCATCHTGTGHNRNPANWPGVTHHEGVNCTLCHKHETDGAPASADAFMPQGSCTSCHGNPPPAGYPSYGLDENLTPHRKHAGNGVGEYGIECSACHDHFDPAYSGHVTEPFSFQDVFFDNLNPNGSYNRSNRTCATLGCHSNGNPSTNQLEHRTPTWDENSTLTCSGCHGDQFNLRTGSHARHLTPMLRDRGADAIGCYECHTDTAQNNNNDGIAKLDNHVDFQKQVKMDLTDLWGAAGQGSFNSVDLTCANSLCHSDGAASREQPGQPVYSTPKWGNSHSGMCSTCHAISPAELTSGAHARHFDSSDQGPGITSCDSCHGSYASENHVNGKVEFVDGRILSETTTCDTCHSPGGAVDGVSEARQNWSNGNPVSCEGCHDSQPSIIKGVTAPDIAGDGSYGFDQTGHGRQGINLQCSVCHLKTAESIHFDGAADSYIADADNFQQTKWLTMGGLNIPITTGESYQSANYVLCYICHRESDQVGLAPGYSNALFTHSDPPPAGYPLTVNEVATGFRNVLAEGYNFGNVPANIHWDHLDMNLVNWDSDEDGSKDSKPSCSTCHDPHGVKLTDNGIAYPAMTNADIGIAHDQDDFGSFGEVTNTAYTLHCDTCHSSAGIKYYQEGVYAFLYLPILLQD